MPTSRSKRAKWILSGAVLAGAIATANSAQAALVLTLSEPGFTPATFTDNTNTAVTDFNGSAIAYGTFTTDIVVGSSNLNYQGSTPSEAILQIQSLQVVSTAGAGETLTISLTETGYTFPGANNGMVYMDSALGGTLTPASSNDLVTFMSTATAISGFPASNVSSGLQQYSPPSGAGGTIGFNEPDANTIWTRGTAFDLTNVTSITMSNVGEAANLSGTTTVTTYSSSVPEPASLGMVAFAALGAIRRPKRSPEPK